MTQSKSNERDSEDEENIIQTFSAAELVMVSYTMAHRVIYAIGQSIDCHENEV